MQVEKWSTRWMSTKTMKKWYHQQPTQQWMRQWMGMYQIAVQYSTELHLSQEKAAKEPPRLGQGPTSHQGTKRPRAKSQEEDDHVTNSRFDETSITQAKRSAASSRESQGSREEREMQAEQAGTVQKLVRCGQVMQTHSTRLNVVQADGCRHAKSKVQ